MSKRPAARIVLWTVAGMVFGIITMLLFDNLARYPFLSAINDCLTMPAVLIIEVLRASGLVPHGDAGFVVIPISIITMWAVWGFLLGLVFEWRISRKKGTTEPIVGLESGRTDGQSRLQCLGVFVKHRKWQCVAISVILVSVCSYCVWQEVILSRDRDFFLHHVEHKLVAQACLGVLTQSRGKSGNLGNFPGTDPRFPEAIRRLEPTFVAVHGDEVSMTKTPRSYYNRLTLRRNRDDYNRYDLIYEEGPSYPRETYLCSIYVRQDGSFVYEKATN